MAETQIAALNGDDGRPFLVQLECTTDPDNGMQDEPLATPVIVLWILPYGSGNMAVGAHLNPALARQLAADLTRMADECEGKRTIPITEANMWMVKGRGPEDGDLTYLPTVTATLSEEGGNPGDAEALQGTPFANALILAYQSGQPINLGNRRAYVTNIVYSTRPE